MARVAYSCNCFPHGGSHTHDVSASIARSRGVLLSHPAFASAGVLACTESSLLRSIQCAIVSMHVVCRRFFQIVSILDKIIRLLTLLPNVPIQGDALSAPLHWYYTWDIAQQHKREFYAGGIRGFVSANPGAMHPDSGKYFSRVIPAENPVPEVFKALGNGRDNPWGSPDAGANYHSNLPAGANTLTMQVRVTTPRESPFL